MQVIKKIFDWVVWSSKNPQNVSLTLKALVPFLVFFNLGDEVSLNGLADTLAQFVVLTVTWVSGAIAVYGALRKIIKSIPMGSQYKG